MWFIPRCVFLLIETLAGWVFRLVNCNRPRGRLPPVDDAIVLESATSLAAKIRRREVTSERVVRACIARAEQVHSFLNCLAERRFEVALSEAREVDELLRTSSKSPEEVERETPFLGVPFTCKESLAVAGLEHSSGFLPRRGHVAEEDADGVRLLKQSGAILIATTIVPELACWWETVSPVRGVGRNPYDFRRTPGGSSGCESALIAAAGSPLGLGTDFYGSIRMPAHMCGIFGHKPSGYLVPSRGNFPDGGEKVEGTFVVGPMARTVGDLRAALGVLAKDKLATLKPLQKSLKNLRVFYMPNDGGGLLSSPVDRDTQQLFSELMAKLSQHGAKVQQVAIPEVSLAAWLFLFDSIRRGGDGDSLAHRMNYPNVKESKNPYVEMFKFLIGKSVHVWPIVLSAIVEHAVQLAMHTPIRKWIFSKVASVREKFRELLECEDDAVFIYPTLPHPALFHKQSCLVPFNPSYTGLFSLLQLPVTQVHLGMSSKDGLPIGVQVAAGKNRDWQCLEAAEEIEKMFNGWTPPFSVDGRQQNGCDQPWKNGRKRASRPVQGRD